MALTRTEDSRESLVVYAPADETYRTVEACFRSVGKVKSADAGFRRVVGKISKNGNPATVTVSVQPESDARCRIEIHANAQEGLIKQHTAPRAVSRLLEAISATGRVPTTPPAVEAETRACPYCAEEIKLQAIVCRFCGRDVKPAG